jgi:hypothetical protein
MYIQKPLVDTSLDFGIANSTLWVEQYQMGLEVENRGAQMVCPVD